MVVSVRTNGPVPTMMVNGTAVPASVALVVGVPPASAGVWLAGTAPVVGVMADDVAAAAVAAGGEAAGGLADSGVRQADETIRGNTISQRTNQREERKGFIPPGSWSAPPGGGQRVSAGP